MDFGLDGVYAAGVLVIHSTCIGWACAWVQEPGWWRDVISSWRNISRRNLEDSIILRNISRSTVSWGGAFVASWPSIHHPCHRVVAMSSSPLRHNEKQRIRTITLLLSPNRGVEGGLLKTAARKETEENFMLVEVESMCVCVFGRWNWVVNSCSS